MKNKQGALALLVIASVLLMLPTAAMAEKPEHERERGSLPLAVNGTFVPSSTSGPLTSFGSGNFAGTFNVQRFEVRNGQLMAVGTVVGALTSTTGQTTDLVIAGVVAPVSTGDPTCSILDLVLGPLHLDLLGLVVDLNQVHLTITGDQAAGSLVGNLLCGVANLLNGGGPLPAVSNLLNGLLGALGL